MSSWEPDDILSLAGKFVCRNHRQVVCDVCCVDYSFLDEQPAPTSGSELTDETQKHAGSQAEPGSSQLQHQNGEARNESRHQPITRFIPDSPIITPRALFPVSYIEKASGDLTNRFAHRSRQSEVLIYTGGACLDNGAADATAGCGFVFGEPFTELATLEEETCSISFRLEMRGPANDVQAQTSNRAELRAVIAALQFRQWNQEDCTRLVIATDSDYVVRGATDWVGSWAQCGWRTWQRTEVKNRDLWELLLAEIRASQRAGTDVCFWRIPRKWNTKADIAAKKGASMPATITFGGRTRREGLAVTSRLLQLPREIRDMIFTNLFVSTRISSGKRSTGRLTAKRIKPCPNALGILRTCRHIYDEVGSTWLSHVLFHFERVEDLLDKLSPLASTTLSQIRHIRTDGEDLVLLPGIGLGQVKYEVAWSLKLLPALYLDRLTVLGSEAGSVAYDTLDGLIKYGNGWRELRFITPNSSMLSFPRYKILLPDRNWRKRQPRTWKKLLLRRDGANSGASITIYRSTRNNAPGTVLNTRTRQTFEQKKSSTQALKNFGIEQERWLSSSKEQGKELLVIVRRGRNADIVEQEQPPYRDSEDIRQMAGGKSWAEIRRQCIENGDDNFFPTEDYNAEVDTYTHVDEYTWPEFH